MRQWLRRAAFGLCLLPAALMAAEGGGERAMVLNLDGAIGPATSDFVVDGLERAAGRGAEVLVLRMDTPGGLDTSMREIVRAVLESPVPVVGYVAPGGARAASAGTYILYAAHVAAMAPGTNLGAATPVQMGAPGLPGGGEAPRKDDGKEKKEKPDGDTAGAPADPKTAKAVNDAAAYIRSLAEMRGRNADWAEKAVRQAASLSAGAALEQGVIDLMADGLASLMDAIDGRKVTVNGVERTLRTAGLPVETLRPDWTTELLAIITDPNVAFILMMIGVYGIIFELSNPGAMVPGIIGGISLVLGLYALHVLPVSYAGLGLLGLGVAFMVAEAFVPSFGALGIGGVVAFALGATLLFDTDIEAFQLSWEVIAATTALSVLLLVLLLAYVVRQMRREVTTGLEEVAGRRAMVVEWGTGHSGRVRLDGETWRAEGPAGLDSETPVRVTGVDGLTLKVEPMTEPETGRTEP